MRDETPSEETLMRLMGKENTTKNRILTNIARSRIKWGIVKMPRISMQN